MIRITTKKNVFNPIEIIISIDISDTEDADSQKLRAKLKGAILSDQNIVYIKVKADYNKKKWLVFQFYTGVEILKIWKK